MKERSSMADRMDVMARSYDRYASLVVPFYEEMQALLLDQLANSHIVPRFVVDLGAGSGILLQRVCSAFPHVNVVWVDRSPAMRAVAGERLRPYQARVTYIEADLLEGWEKRLPEPPTHIFSMSAIHHLVDADKARLYRRCFEALAPRGMFWNADEVRAADPSEYQRTLEEWDIHMTRLIHQGRVDEVITSTWEAWRERNLRQTMPKRSGDDCHATVEAQLLMLLEAGYPKPVQLWSKGLWSVFGSLK